MSELKAYTSVDIEEMDNVRLYHDYKLDRTNCTLVYLKSEADKVITHHKYKRCLAMAEMLEHICPRTIRKAKWKGKWHMHWLVLAEKFKEA